MASEPEELLFALCHELRNLALASSLQSHYLRDPDEPPDPATLESVAATLSFVAARSGSLLAQIRPLLAPESIRLESVEPIDVLDDLRSGMDEQCESRLRIELKSAAALPDVSANAESLHHVLLTEIFAAYDCQPGPVTARAETRGSEVVFSLNPGAPNRGGEPLTGVAVSRAIAAEILQHFGAEMEFDAGSSEVRICVPIVASPGDRA